MRLSPTTTAIATPTVTNANRDARLGSARPNATASAIHVTAYAACADGYADRSVEMSGSGGRTRSVDALATCTAAYVSASPAASTADSASSRRHSSTASDTAASAATTGNAPRFVTTLAMPTNGAASRRCVISRTRSSPIGTSPAWSVRICATNVYAPTPATATSVVTSR